jgi:hypothetical protein
MSFHTALSDGFDRLYHWQRFDADRLKHSLRENLIYCADPSTFNDPWDCKLHINTEILDDPIENERYVQWAISLCRRYNRNMSESQIELLGQRLRTDRAFHEAQIHEMSRQLSAFIPKRYRVYCLGPDVNNLLMWAHYADSHRGICIEFKTRDTVMCSALRVEYSEAYPLVRGYSTSEEENLVPLLTKADAWRYEREYRLIAQERGNSTPHETLLTDNNFLRINGSSILSIIVGCQGNFDDAQDVVAAVAPHLTVKRASRVPNRFELAITA